MRTLIKCQFTQNMHGPWSGLKGLQSMELTLKRALIGVSCSWSSGVHSSKASKSIGNFMSFKTLALTDSFSL